MKKSILTIILIAFTLLAFSQAKPDTAAQKAKLHRRAR